MAVEQWDPVANPEAVVVCAAGKGSAAARFTALTDRLIRMEWAPDGRFEDRASQTFVNRWLPAPAGLRVSREGALTRIETGRVTLSFWADGKAFHRDNLWVEFECAGARARWRPGDTDLGNLGGTTRTLDNVDGSCPVEPGLLSRHGWVVVDDSERLVFTPGERGGAGVRAWDWMAERDAAPGTIDWYIFAHGRDYKGALQDFAKVAGRVPLPPRYVFGSWWSRYWAYTEEELIGLVEEFRLHDVPIDVLVIDMDWHLDGWTGYTWNRELFPDPAGFLQWTDTHGLQITLNLHPADGVGAHEEAFADVCRDLGLDPKTTERVAFDSTDPAFVQSYFTRLHWPLEAMGVDFWWMDWQQGTTTNIPGLDPMWWLNHLHWEDMKRRTTGDAIRRGRRPLIFSRWGGLGNHRYPIGFSGDTYSTWKSLAWQPPFTAMAGNVGYFYWSHDIGGHQPGPVELELYARWVQFGALSPALRTHTSKNPLGERRIWASPQREFRAMREAFLLRYALIPYIYTQARRSYDETVPLCRPLYVEWPELEEAYRRPGQYLFGDDLLAAPVTEPGDATGRAAATTVWIPPGSWTHWFTGETFDGPCERELLTPIDQIPLFAHGGAIIPAAPMMRWTSEKPLDPLILHVFPAAPDAPEGETFRTRLYEDDGEGAGYERGECAWTALSSEQLAGAITVTVGGAVGSFPGMVEERAIELRLRDQWPAKRVVVDGESLERAAPGSDSGWWYERDELAIVVRTARRSVRRPTRVEIALGSADRSALRGGLRGRIGTMKRVARLLGDATPRRLAKAIARFDEAAGDDGFAARGMALGSLDVWELAWEIAQAGGANGAARDEALCALLGLSCRVEVDSVASGRARTRATARLLHAAGLDLELAAAPSRPWELRDCVTSRRERVGGSLVCGLEQVWHVERTLQQTTLRATARVRRRDGRGAPIELTFTESVLPSINGWWVVGPFPEPFGPRQLDRVFEPELRPDPAATYMREGAPLAWKRIERRLASGDDPKREFFVDLNKALGGQHEDCVAYALTRVRAPRSGPAILAMGSDDGIVAWVNGVEVHRNQTQRGYGSRQDRVRITLREGVNEVLLKIGQAKLAWGFGAHIEDEDRRAIEGVEVEGGGEALGARH